MCASRRFVLRGGWCAVGLMVVGVGWGCAGGAHRAADIPVVEIVVLDGFGFESEFTAEDSAAVQRLENGEGPVRVRMVMCDEVLVDEVVATSDEFGEVMERSLMEEFEMTEEWSQEALAELEALDKDSVAAVWAAQWEAMSPAERDEFTAEMERVMSILSDLDAVLDDETPDPEALKTMQAEILKGASPEVIEAMEDARDTGCDEWRKMRAKFREKTSKDGSGEARKGSG